MTVGLLTNIVSPHQLPLAHAVSRLIGAENYRYVYTEDFHSERARMGWGDDVSDCGFKVCKYDDESRRWLEAADFVYTEERDLDLIATRLAAGKATAYVSERWFRPPYGCLRLLHPAFLRMAWRMVGLLRKKNFYYLPQGVHAWRDMKWLCRLFGFLNCERTFRMWGYFVAPSEIPSPPASVSGSARALRVLWVGRMLRLKRVDDIVRAVARANEEFGRQTCPPSTRDFDSVSLTLVGDGDRKPALMRLARKLERKRDRRSSCRAPASSVAFLPSVPIGEVRTLMRQHDVYVFPSDSREGWGAVVSEAMEEGMLVIGSREAGASATMLPASHLFHAGDWRRLAHLLLQAADGKLKRIPIGNWSAAKAAEKMLEMVR